MPTSSQLEPIAREVFGQVRTTIVLNMRFMDMAVFRLRPVAAPVTLATDGERLYYAPEWLLRRYRAESNAVTRDYLHALMHCVFRHPFVHTLVDRDLWDLACDIAVEGLICELDQPHFATRSEARRKAVADGLRQHVKPLTAEKLYHWFQSHPPEPGWAALFRADDHEIWHEPARARQLSRQAQPRDDRGDDSQKSRSGGQRQDGEKRQDASGNDQTRSGQPQNGDPRNESGSDQSQNGGQQNVPGSGQGQNGDPCNDTGDNQSQSGGQSQNGDGRQDAPGGDRSQSGGQSQDGDPRNEPGGDPTHGDGTGSGEQPFEPRPDRGSGGEETGPQPDVSSRQALEDEWRDISEHVQMDLETFAKEQGLKAGGMEQLLAELNREKYDYEAFLKKFAVSGEVMKINDDEFDYIFYTYGLKLFGNMPLIEPLEYKEVKRIREFVIAIDTSGSTSGDLVNRFLTKTYNILMSTESFFSKVNIHIVQCDAAIQEAVKITNREEFEDYLKRMTIRGLGGTDFRPVFAYVDQLIRQREFKRLKGLIYFTDGYGTFPERKPDYSTAFVFVQDAYNNLDVPPWAIKLILEKEEV